MTSSGEGTGSPWGIAVKTGHTSFSTMPLKCAGVGKFSSTKAWLTVRAALQQGLHP